MTFSDAEAVKYLDDMRFLGYNIIVSISPDETVTSKAEALSEVVRDFTLKNLIVVVTSSTTTLSMKDDSDVIDTQAVEAQIATLGEISLESEAAIKGARDAFNTLTSEQKALVKNEASLTAAEQKLAQLKDQTAAEAVVAKIHMVDPALVGLT